MNLQPILFAMAAAIDTVILLPSCIVCEAVLKVAEQNRWILREFEIDDGCYKIEGRHKGGRRIKVELDPATLNVVEMEFYSLSGNASLLAATVDDAKP